MELVAGDDETQGAHGDRVAVRDAAASQVVLREIAKDVDRCRSNGLKFVGQPADATLVESASRHIGVLVEATDRFRVATVEADGTIDKDCLPGPHEPYPL